MTKTPADARAYLGRTQKLCPFCGASVELQEVPTAADDIIHHPPLDRNCILSDKFFSLTGWNRRTDR